MSDKNPVFEETYRNYIRQIGERDLARLASVLDVEYDGSALLVPLLGKLYRVSGSGIETSSGKRPSHAVIVTLTKYVTLCPDSPPANGMEWVTYREFRDAAPFVGGFAGNAESPVARNFSGRMESLQAACKKMEGLPIEESLPYQVVSRFQALPRVPILLLFNDSDEEFPSTCTLCFERRAERYLDMECLAMIGWLLSDALARTAGLGRDTIM